MTPQELDRCPSCNAPHDLQEAFCWMCHRKLYDLPVLQKNFEPLPIPNPEPVAEPDPIVPPKQKPRPVLRPGLHPSTKTSQPHTELDGLTQPILIGAFILILAGLATGSEGRPLLWLGLIPALFITAFTGLRNVNAKPQTVTEKIGWAITQFVGIVAIVILAALFIALAFYIALWAICGQVLGMGRH